MSTPLLAFRDVGKAWRGRRVLTNINLEIHQGQSTALLGINGAGKSTLLRLASDWLAPDSGQVLINDLPVRDPKARQAMAYLPEHFLPPHYLTGAELLATLLIQHGVAYEPARVTEECARLRFDQADLARRARHYSKGMTRKLGLLACLLARPSLLIMDEPTDGLDPQAQRDCRERLQALRAAGTTLLFSSHLLNELPQLCERVVVLHLGRIVFDGDLAEFLTLAPTAQPEAAFLASISVT